MAGNLREIVKRLEASDSHDVAVLHDAVKVLSESRAVKAGGAALSAQDVESTDAVLHLIDAVIPGWTIRISGKATEPNGHWNCTLRRSSARDNDEFIGSGQGKVLAHALVAALLLTVDYLKTHEPSA